MSNLDHGSDEEIIALGFFFSLNQVQAQNKSNLMETHHCHGKLVDFIWEWSPIGWDHPPLYLLDDRGRLRE
jgi:hypothetical protein